MISNSPEFKKEMNYLSLAINATLLFWSFMAGVLLLNILYGKVSLMTAGGAGIIAAVVLSLGWFPFKLHKWVKSFCNSSL